MRMNEPGQRIDHKCYVHPKGTTTRRLIRDFWEEHHLKHGYQLVHTPHIARGELWKTSGHLDYYAENMYAFEKEDRLLLLCLFWIDRSTL